MLDIQIPSLQRPNWFSGEPGHRGLRLKTKNSPSFKRGELSIMPFDLYLIFIPYRPRWTGLKVERTAQSW